MGISTKLRASIVMASLAVIGAGSAFAATASASNDVSIPFVNHGGIRNWQADRDRGLWVQDIHGKWYYASLLGPCWGLNFAQSIGFDTRPLGSFDRFSSVVIPGSGRCVVQTLTRSEGPPVKRKANAAAAADAKS